MQGWGGVWCACRGGVGHVGVVGWSIMQGWVMQGGMGHVGMGWGVNNFICHKLGVIQRMLCMCMHTMNMLRQEITKGYRTWKEQCTHQLPKTSRKMYMPMLQMSPFQQNPNETGNLLGVLRVKVGACVMLTTNVDVTDGLTNGAMGTVTNVVCTGNKIDVILVQFDNPSVGERAIMWSKFKHI